MNLLAIETATEACSVALLSAQGVIERYELAPRRHGERVLPMIDEVLAEAGLGRNAIDGVAVGRGPGAFTGVRLAISVAQGIALALDRPVAAVSSLAALALAVRAAALDLRNGGHTPAILALGDARMGEIYSGWFVVDGDGLVGADSAEQLVTADSLPLPSGAPWIVVGNGYAAHAERLDTRMGDRCVARFPDLLPRASAVARLGLREFSSGRAVDAALVEPIYLRDKVALTKAEREPRT